MKKSVKKRVYDMLEEPGPDEEFDDTCGFLFVVVGAVALFLVVAVIATVIVLGVDERTSISSLTSSHPVRPMSAKVMDSIMDPSHMYHRTIDNTATSDDTTELDLLVLVHSLPGNRSARDAIRDTWMKDTPDSVEVLFVVPAQGMDVSTLEAVKQESKTHQDMVVFLDSPVIPESEALMLELVWSVRSRKFAYMLKTRDSMYVRLDALINEVVKGLLITRSNAYLGYFQGHQIPNQKDSTKHPEPTWFLCDKFIRFAHSGGYILSKKLVNRLESQVSMLYPYNNEDVSMATWLSPYADIDWVHSIQFDTEVGKPRGCKNNLIVFPSTDMLKQHNRLLNSGNVCLLEHETLQTYRYNFDAFPSQCCNSVVKFNDV
jgi:galactosylxylosylprotein 3-beta-galactosyltransferase